MSPRCRLCNRSFDSDTSLQKHKRDSPAHTFDCTTCHRHYGNETALQQHLRNSRVHAPSFDCETCGRSFNKNEALQQHLRDSPAHTRSFRCETCDRSFGSEKALAQHLRDSPIHKQNTETPLDVFFRSFSTFGYDPCLPPATSYAKLREHEGWRRRDAESEDAWDRYQAALESELNMWYIGEEDDLTAWHALLRAVGITPLPMTCEQCEQAARRTHVNIIDLIQWRRGYSKGNLQTFRNVAELREYTIDSDKIFRNTCKREAEGGNPVLRHLLRRIFMGSV